MYKLSSKSRQKLEGVHCDLVTVVEYAIQLTEIDFAVTEGLRSSLRQKKLVQCGASQTLNSRHLTGHAVDLVALIDGEVSWDWVHYREIARAMKQAADELNIEIEWGGDWKGLKDGPHFQLSWRLYPAQKRLSA